MLGRLGHLLNVVSEKISHVQAQEAIVVSISEIGVQNVQEKHL